MESVGNADNKNQFNSGYNKGGGVFSARARAQAVSGRPGNLKHAYTSARDGTDGSSQRLHAHQGPQLLKDEERDDGMRP